MAEFTKTITETVNCPGCGHNQVIKNGNQAGQQRYQCKACKKQFRANGKSTGRRIPDEQAGGAVRMYFGGMSYKQIGETMADLYNIPEPSKASVYEWVTDFGQQAVKEMAKHPAQVGDTWVADEMMVQVGGEKYWNWNVMDEDTRYILASYLSKNRDTAAARAVMRKAKANSAVTPTEIKTDKWRAYLRAIREEFPDTKHVQSPGSDRRGEQQPERAAARDVPAAYQNLAGSGAPGIGPALPGRLGTGLQPVPGTRGLGRQDAGGGGQSQRALPGVGGRGAGGLG